MSRTLREWRDLRGLSREELAGRIGVTAGMVERWEEIGLDAEPCSRIGDFFISKLMEALDADEGLRIEYVPDSPNPGDLVITPGPELDIGALLERAGVLNLRMAVPDRWGLSLKPPKDVSTEDQAALTRYFEREAAYSARIVGLLDNTLEMLGGNSGEWKEGQTLGQRLEEADRELGRDLDSRGMGA